MTKISSGVQRSTYPCYLLSLEEFLSFQHLGIAHRYSALFEQIHHFLQRMSFFSDEIYQDIRPWQGARWILFVINRESRSNSSKRNVSRLPHTYGGKIIEIRFGDATDLCSQQGTNLFRSHLRSFETLVRLINSRESISFRHATLNIKETR